MDQIDEMFASLGEFYPGSKRKRREVAPVAQSATPEAGSWEDDFILKYLPNGNQVQMYTISSLGKALNKSVQVIRYWIDLGYFPASPYRMPSTIGKNGKEYAGKRLYTKAMVDAAVEIFVSAGIFSTTRVDWSVHRNLGDKIAEAWDAIRAEETKQTKKE